MFYALHYSRTYEKAGSWECLRTPVDLQLANSNWTADQIFAETGIQFMPLNSLYSLYAHQQADPAGRQPLHAGGKIAEHRLLGQAQPVAEQLRQCTRLECLFGAQTV